MTINDYTSGGGGATKTHGGDWHLEIKDAQSGQLSCSQLDDYRLLSSRDFPHRPPVKLSLWARFSHPASRFSGTAGFGFWNDPFMMSGRKKLTLPVASWFFLAGKDCHMEMVDGQGGQGLKAATLNGWRLPFLFNLPLLPFQLPWMRSTRFRRWLWPKWKKWAAVEERTLELDLCAWQKYELEWLEHKTIFRINGVVVLTSAPAPKGPFGLVIWLDNQVLQLRPWGSLRYYRANIQNQWMEIRDLQVSSIG